jgi:hypothetical protein
VSGTRRKPGRLGPYVEGYRARLLELGYSPLSVTRSLTALGHLGRWMEREGVDVDQLDDRAVNAFLTDHVKDRGQLPTAGVLPLLDYPRAEGAVAPESAALRSALDRLIADYQVWLVGERELAPATVRGYAELARTHGTAIGALGPVGGTLARGRHPTGAVATGGRAAAGVVRPIEPGRRARFRDPHPARAARSARGRGLPA